MNLGKEFTSKTDVKKNKCPLRFHEVPSNGFPLNFDSERVIIP